MSGLPGILGRIAELAGESAATRLALSAGGTRMKFSKRPGSTLVRIVGLEAARVIHAEFGAGVYDIPMAHLRGQKGRRAAAMEMFAKGVTNNEVAQAVDMHERTARRIRKAMTIALSTSLPLFPDEEDED